MSITFKRSNVPGKLPSPGDLSVGEFAINFADKRIYTKSPEGDIIIVGSAPIDMSEYYKKHESLALSIAMG